MVGLAQEARPPWYERELNPLFGYTPGELLPDDLAEERLTRSAESVVLWRFEKYGFDSLHNLMGLVENCRIPEWFSGPEYEHRILSHKLLEERLNELARAHLGAGDDFEAMAFNRVSLANITAVSALTTPGASAVYLVPRYIGKPFGYAHISVAAGMEMARLRWSMVLSAQEFAEVVEREQDTQLLVICPHYRGYIEEDEMVEACAIANAHGIPVYVDDASGARSRPLEYGQAPAVAMGADLVVTSMDKIGLNGPRAGVLLGRQDLMLRVSATARLIGSAARPSVTAAIIRTLDDHTPAELASKYATWERRHRQIHASVQPKVSVTVHVSGINGIVITLSDFMDLVLDRAGLEPKEVPHAAPVDVACAHAMVMLRQDGVMNGVPFFYQGASKFPYIRVNTLTTSISDEELATAFLEAIDVVAEALPSPGALERILFAPPGDELSGGRRLRAEGAPARSSG